MTSYLSCVHQQQQKKETHAQTAHAEPFFLRCIEIKYGSIGTVESTIRNGRDMDPLIVI